MADELPWRELREVLEEIASPGSREEFRAGILPAMKMLVPCGVAASLRDNHAKCLKCAAYSRMQQ